MSEKRKKIAAFCLKIGATTVKVELFEAELWEDGEPASFRARINGRWHDTPSGEKLWLDFEEVAALMRNLLLFGSDVPPPPSLPPRPVVKKGQLVSLPCGPYSSRGEPLCRELGRIVSEDTMLGHDGKWYVIAGGVKVRLGFVAYDDLILMLGKNAKTEENDDQDRQ